MCVWVGYDAGVWQDVLYIRNVGTFQTHSVVKILLTELM